MALAQFAGQTVAAAAITDVWESVRGRFARLLGRGDARKAQVAEQWLAQTRQQLAAATGSGLEQAQGVAAERWAGRFADLLDEDPSIEADLRALGLVNEPLSIRMTGCPNGCARPYTSEIGIVGRTKDVYNVYAGGDRLNTRLNTLYAASVHVKDLAATLHPLLVLWRDEREPGESFGDFCYRVGLDYLHARTEENRVGAQCIAPHRQ